MDETGGKGNSKLSIERLALFLGTTRAFACSGGRPARQIRNDPTRGRVEQQPRRPRSPPHWRTHAPWRVLAGVQPGKSGTSRREGASNSSRGGRAPHRIGEHTRLCVFWRAPSPANQERFDARARRTAAEAAALPTALENTRASRVLAGAQPGKSGTIRREGVSNSSRGGRAPRYRIC